MTVKLLFSKNCFFGVIVLILPFKPSSLIQEIFKYSVYALLTLNIFLFWNEEFLATQETFSQGIRLEDIIQGFAATIDTAAWVSLLILFELETHILSPQKLSQPRIKLSFAFVRMFSYGFILYAFYGYFTKMLLISGVSPLYTEDACVLIGQNFSVINNLDEYPPLSYDNCTVLNGTDLFSLDGQSIIGNAQQWSAIQWLTRVDVINSLAWILIVVVLEIDIRLRQKNRLSDSIILLNKITKVLLYVTVLFAATYWGFLGDFLDFWDAFLWIVAFFFIEMNIFSEDSKRLLL